MIIYKGELSFRRVSKNILLILVSEIFRNPFLILYSVFTKLFFILFLLHTEVLKVLDQNMHLIVYLSLLQIHLMICNSNANHRKSHKFTLSTRNRQFLLELQIIVSGGKIKYRIGMYLSRKNHIAPEFGNVSFNSHFAFNNNFKFPL